MDIHTHLEKEVTSCCQPFNCQMAAEPALQWTFAKEFSADFQSRITGLL
jgi:hypothetical protein